MIDAQVTYRKQRTTRDRNMKQRCGETVCIALFVTAAAATLTGCTVSYYGEANTGSSVEAEYSARWPESDAHTDHNGVRHGAFTGDQ
jgi:hypothetical protein